jgi:hypothetical protein
MNSKQIKLTADFEITMAAAMSEDGKPALPKFVMKAYDGEPMEVGGWGNTVIDVSGIKANDSTPILFGHDSRSVYSIMGMTDKVHLENGVFASGAIMGESDIAKQVVALAKNGYKFQASVGLWPDDTEQVAANDSRTVNGRSIQGPYTLVKSGTLREISIVPLGADSDTETAIAAEHNAQQAHKHEEKTMSEKTQKTAEDIRAEAVAEQNRILTVQAAAKDFADIAKQAVEAGWDESQTKMAVLEAKNKALEAKIKADEEAAQRPSAPAISTGAKPKVNAQVIEASVAIRNGLKNAEKRYSQDTLNAAEDMNIRSLTELVQASLAVDGKRLDASRQDTQGFLQAAFSTRTIANVLSNLANKFILEGYGTVEQTWRAISNIRSVVDFKANTGVRLVMSNLLKELAPNGEIEHGTISDETRTVQADTKALMLGVTRKDIINDDLGVITDLPRRLGYAAARTFNTDFWAAFEAAVAANFETGGTKKNQQVGVLSLATLKTAEKLFMELKDADGNPIGADAMTLLVSPTNSATAREIFTASNLVGGNSKELNTNIYAGMFTPAVSRYLSANPWYLVASPLAMPLMQVAFLNGRQEPFVETADADFNTLGVQMRCYYDYGAAFGEWRSAVRSTGAAS